MLGFAETVDYIFETDKGDQHKADSRVGTGMFTGYVWRTTDYLKDQQEESGGDLL